MRVGSGAVHKLVLAYGDPLQYSVYLCDLTDVELVSLRSRLRETIHHELDAVSLFDLGRTDARPHRVEHLGRPATVPTDGPAIW